MIDSSYILTAVNNLNRNNAMNLESFDTMSKNNILENNVLLQEKINPNKSTNLESVNILQQEKIKPNIISEQIIEQLDDIKQTFDLPHNIHVLDINFLKNHKNIQYHIENDAIIFSFTLSDYAVRSICSIQNNTLSIPGSSFVLEDDFEEEWSTQVIHKLLKTFDLKIKHIISMPYETKVTGITINDLLQKLNITQIINKIKLHFTIEEVIIKETIKEDVLFLEQAEEVYDDYISYDSMF